MASWLYTKTRILKPATPPFVTLVSTAVSNFVAKTHQHDYMRKHARHVNTITCANMRVRAAPIT